jgi:hypothetical protein
MNNEVSKKRFDHDYVINKTSEYMEKVVDTSIRKAFDKVPVHVDDVEKSKEIFTTLTELHGIRKWVQSLRISKPQSTKGI